MLVTDGVRIRKSVQKTNATVSKTETQLIVLRFDYTRMRGDDIHVNMMFDGESVALTGGLSSQ